ncbi:protein FAM227B isoform X2 [Hyperolius riggenbachi]
MWPEYPFLEEYPPVEIPSLNRFSPKNIYEEFLRRIPLDSQVFDDLEAKIAEDMTRLSIYASQIFYLSISEDCLCPVTRAFVTEVDLLELSQKAQEKFEEFTRITCEEREKRVEDCMFPGLNRTDLPGNLKATQILQVLAESNHYQVGCGKALSKYLLSKESEAILKDCFWWCFLHRFKPQHLEQAHLFDRIADCFVTLFCHVSPDIKDLFIKLYPDYLSQAVFTAFYKAFPQSCPQFNGEFKSEIVDIIFQWVTGIKPIPGSWSKWDLHYLGKKQEQFSNGKVSNPLESQPDDVKWRLEFNLDDLIQEARDSNLPKNSTAEKKLPVRESHSIGSGPEFCHTLFPLGGHSLLVLNYLKRHKMKDFVPAGSRNKLKRSEISKLPPAGRTYQDVIKETQNTRKSLQQKYDRLDAKTQQEQLEIHQQNVIVKKQIERMKQELSTGVKVNTSLLLNKLHKMPFSSKQFLKDSLTIQDVLDADDSEPDSEKA